MKIKFTLFNGGQEQVEFDANSLAEGWEIDRFLVSKDDDGKIYIVPMLHKNGVRSPGEILGVFKE